MDATNTGLDWIDSIVAFAGFLFVYVSAQRYVNDLRDKLLQADGLSTIGHRQVRVWLSDWRALQLGAFAALFIFFLFSIFMLFSVMNRPWYVRGAVLMLVITAALITVMHFISLQEDGKMLGATHPGKCRKTLTGIKLDKRKNDFVSTAES